MTQIATRSNDAGLHHAVRRELEYETTLDAARIGVVVNQGIVTLVGSAKSVEDKELASRVAHRASGVRALVNHLQVDEDGITRWSDEAIALNTAEWLAQKFDTAAQTVTISVEKGHVTLGGKLETDLLKRQVEKEVAKLAGVGGITNTIIVAGAVPADVIEREIHEALQSLGPLSDRSIVVLADHGRITLDGRVQSWHAREAAEHAARSCPGVRHVDNRLFVDW